jgi:Tfp pilus assembly protein PilX
MLHCVNPYKQTGFALFTVLLFMQIMMMLSWYAIESSMIEMRMTQEHLHYELNRREEEHDNTER